MPARKRTAGFDAKTVGRFAVLILLWLIGLSVVWALTATTYNRFLTLSAENLVHIFESPNVTELVRHDEHYVVIQRNDFPKGRGRVGSLRATDIHFPVVLLGALFLAVPGVPWRNKLENLGIALLVMVFFHLILFVFWIKFTYATQLGQWSADNYGVVAQNFWGFGKHLLDIPIKLALPFALWAVFYLGPLLRKMQGKTAEA